VITIGSVMYGPPSPGPGGDDRQRRQIDVGLDTCWQGALRTVLGVAGGDARQLGQHAQLVHQPVGRLRLHQLEDRARVLVQVGDAQRPRHALARGVRC
jgi:hypothetical protein